MLQELGVGVVAGAVSKGVTMPLANVVARLQTQTTSIDTASTEKRPEGRPEDSFTQASLDAKSPPRPAPTAIQTLHSILSTSGPLSLWAGYPQTLLLTLNPALTFLLYETLKRIVPGRRARDPKVAVGRTFLVAAVAKMVVGAVAYPVIVGGKRAMAGQKAVEPTTREEESANGREKASETAAEKASEEAAEKPSAEPGKQDVRTNEKGSVYGGLQIELLKSFLGYGATMALKLAVLNAVVRFWRVLSNALQFLRGSEHANAGYASTLLKQGEEKLSIPEVKEQALKVKDSFQKVATRDAGFEYYDLARRRVAEQVRLLGRVAGGVVDRADLVGDYVDGDAEGLNGWLGEGKGED